MIYVTSNGKRDAYFCKRRITCRLLRHFAYPRRNAYNQTTYDCLHMKNFLDVSIAAVTGLTSESAVVVVRAILRCECGYAKLSPSALTISSRLTTADGGIDAEIRVPTGVMVPSDCFFQSGLTGFQIKSGTAFKPWTPSAMAANLETDGFGFRRRRGRS